MSMPSFRSGLALYSALGLIILVGLLAGGAALTIRHFRTSSTAAAQHTATRSNSATVADVNPIDASNGPIGSSPSNYVALTGTTRTTTAIPKRTVPAAPASAPKSSSTPAVTPSPAATAPMPTSAAPMAPTLPLNTAVPVSTPDPATPVGSPVPVILAGPLHTLGPRPLTYSLANDFSSQEISAFLGQEIWFDLTSLGSRQVSTSFDPHVFSELNPAILNSDTGTYSNEVLRAIAPSEGSTATFTISARCTPGQECPDSIQKRTATIRVMAATLK